MMTRDWYVREAAFAYRRAGWTFPEMRKDWKRRIDAGESPASIWLTMNAQAAIR